MHTLFSRFLRKGIVTVQNSLSSNYSLRVSADGANHNVVRPFFNTKIILNLILIVTYSHPAEPDLDSRFKTSNL